MAAYRGHLEIVKFLVNLDDTTQNYDHAIDLAKEENKQEVVEFLKTCTTSTDTTEMPILHALFYCISLIKSCIWNNV